MNLLAELYNNQQNITQNPTGTIRTPRQMAYDNWLNAQQQAQNTTKDEWGQAIGNSVNGLAKIISSAVVKDPYQKAGATRNLDNFDDRQDQLVRDWAMQRMKNRNDFVQQAKEQLGLATADEEREYEKEQNALNRAYREMIDNRNWENTIEQQNIANKLNQDKLDLQRDIAEFNKQQAIATAKNAPAEMTPEEKIAFEVAKEEAKAQAQAKREANQELNKANAEFEAFKSNIPNLQSLSKASGSTVSRAIGGVGNIFDAITGKDTGITKPNDAMQEVKAQLVQAIFKANGIDGDKISKEQSKIILRQAGMPDSGDLSKSQVNTIINNIKSIYEQRIKGKQNLADSFNNNSVSWEK